MTACVALLRAVNVGGTKKLPMAELKAFLERIGLKDVRTLLQSGNAVFSAAGPSGERLERLLEAEAKKRLGLETGFFVRTAAELDEAIARNPFPKEAERDPGRLVVVFLKSAPSAASVKALRAAIVGRETVHAAGRHAWIVYPDGQGTSKLTISVIERHLGTRGTARNWNTVGKLAALLSSS